HLIGARRRYLTSADGGTSLGMIRRRRQRPTMWKSIVLCVSLFGGAAMGLALGARFVEPAALPAAAAIGLCLIGVVLILSAPTSVEEATTALEEATTARVAVVTEASVEPIADRRKMPVAAAAVTPAAKNRTPARPLEALNG